MTQLLLEAENLWKQYPGAPAPAVRNVSFSLAGGEILALLGPNGAGKTSVIKMALGLVTPTSGTATICGCDMASGRTRRHGNRHVGAVLEGARNVYWRLSARENLRYFGALRGLRGQALEARVQFLLALVGLEGEADRDVRQFSRGMQQKVAIAVALLGDPEVVVLDEPTLGLDVAAAKSLEQTIAELATAGKGVLLTTHVMALAERLASRVVVMNQGVVIANEAKVELLRRFDLRTIVDVTLETAVSEVCWQQLQQQFPAVVQTVHENRPTLTWMGATQSEAAGLFHFLNEQQVPVLSIRRREARLEEAFLSLTGQMPLDSSGGQPSSVEPEVVA